jgi:hypothetical protein
LYRAGDEEVLPSSLLENPEFDPLSLPRADDRDESDSDMEDLDTRIAREIERNDETMERDKRRNGASLDFDFLDGPSSPQNGTNPNLPSFQHIDEIAKKAIDNLKRYSDDVGTPSTVSSDSSSSPQNQISQKLPNFRQFEEIARKAKENLRRFRGVGGMPDAVSPYGPGERAVKLQKRAHKFPVSRNRRGLPVTFEDPESPATVMCCPDTGSEINAISFELARLLRFDVDYDVDTPSMATTLANGKPHFAVGIATVDCILDSATRNEPPNFLSTFYVFYELAEPYIYVGRGFLQLTETLSKYSERLLPRCPIVQAAPLVRSIGRQHEVLECCLNGVKVQAVPDTGAEVNLMSRSFAEDCGFAIQDGSICIRYADGSHAQSDGLVVAEVAVGFDSPTYAPSISSTSTNAEENLEPKNQEPVVTSSSTLTPAVDQRYDEDVRRVVEVIFHLTQDLVTEVLIGEDALAVLQPHRLNPENFTWSSNSRSQNPYMNRITEVRRPSKLRRLAAAIGFGGK